MPVIVSNHVGAKDIIGKNGIIFEAGNKEELKKAIMLSKDLKVEKIVIEEWKEFVKKNYILYQS